MRPANAVQIGAMAAGLTLSLWAAVDAYQYGVAYPTAVIGSARLVALTAIEWGIGLYDPYPVRRAVTGPPDKEAVGADFHAIEQVLPLQTPVRLGATFDVTLTAVSNEAIRYSPFEFAYQTWDEPRLHELRRRFNLERVVAGAQNDFDEVIALRNWTRSQFRRKDYQPRSAHFDALEILTRNLRNDRDEPYSPTKHYDPCVLFPMLYIQVLLSMGHQGRLMSVDHGIVEVWSNHYRKWVVMDAELNHHFEKDGVPQSFTDLQAESRVPTASRVRLMVGTQWSGDPSTTIVHLKVPHLTTQEVLPWFDRPADIAAMRNDWMTNRYFRGHPRRSDRDGLILLDARHSQPKYVVRARPTTRSATRFNWTINTAQVVVRRPRSPRLEVGFATHTPNFDHFVVTVNGVPRLIRSATMSWDLVDGEHTLEVAPVNKAGIRGITSYARLRVDPVDQNRRQSAKAGP